MPGEACGLASHGFGAPRFPPGMKPRCFQIGARRRESEVQRTSTKGVLPVKRRQCRGRKGFQSRSIGEFGIEPGKTPVDLGNPGRSGGKPRERRIATQAGQPHKRGKPAPLGRGGRPSHPARRARAASAKRIAAATAA